jgi:hypothetical protein
MSPHSTKLAPWLPPLSLRKLRTHAIFPSQNGIAPPSNPG